MDVANTTCKIIQDWLTNSNDGIEHLAFRIIGQSHMVHHVNYLTNIHSKVIGF
jgi:hypothetical protein